MGFVFNWVEVVVLSNNNMWYYIFIYGIFTKQNRYDNDTMEIKKGAFAPFVFIGYYNDLKL